MKTRILRYTMLTAVLAMVLRLALGRGSRSFEAYCPFGGVESLWGLCTTGQFTCALGPLNLSMLVAIVGLAVVAKKSFCGWVCPVGFLGELTGRLGGRLYRKRPRVRAGVDAKLRLLRYPVLVLALLFTYRSGELILRGYDPYYAIFSGLGHGTLGTATVLVLAGLAAGGLVVPMFFCRYLCPLGATLDPFSRLGLVKVSHRPEECTGCGLCRDACPHQLSPHDSDAVRHRDCTNCLECVDACPVAGVLELKLMR